MAYTTVNKPTDFFNTLLYTGTGAENALTGVGFQPDWIWLKKRGASGHHFLQDSVRGPTYQLQSSTGNAETNNAQYVKSIQSDGFTLGTDTDVNPNGGTAVAWNWKAAGSTSTNNDGSVTSTVSANTTSGFSIVSYTGTGSTTTVGHGLGAKPSVVIYKQRNTTNAWRIMTDVTGTLKRLYLNATDAEASIIDSSTAPTSTVLNIGTGSEVNTSSGTYIAYCFAEKTGYSRFGTYAGNSNTDGSFVYTGFKPAWILAKAASGNQTPQNQSWVIWDNKRSASGGFNENSYKLYPNATDAEATSGIAQVDILSNGFKFRNSTHQSNSDNTYFYMAFAEAPIVGTNNIPATAR